MKKTIEIFAVISDNRIIGMYLNRELAEEIAKECHNEYDEYEIQKIELDNDIINEIKGI